MIYNVINDTLKRIVLFTFVRDCDAPSWPSWSSESFAQSVMGCTFIIEFRNNNNNNLLNALCAISRYHRFFAISLFKSTKALIAKIISNPETVAQLFSTLSDRNQIISQRFENGKQLFIMAYTRCVRIQYFFAKGLIMLIFRRFFYCFDSNTP